MDKAGVELAGVELFLTEMLLLLPEKPFLFFLERFILRQIICSVFR